MCSTNDGVNQTRAVTWGIDVSKERLDVAQWPDTRTWQVPNNPDGWAQLIARADAAPPEQIVLEASGAYEVRLVLALADAGHPPVVLNPVVARRFAQSLGHLAKTDSVDARMLARFGAERQPTPRPILSETARNLAALLALRDDLVGAKVAAANRRHQAAVIVRPHLDRQLADLADQIGAVEADLARLVAADVAIAATVTLLVSVKGFGQLLATTVAVGLPELGTGTGKQLAALVGVAPFANDSGTRRGVRSIRGGRRSVRRALYQATMTMIRWDPGTRTFYRRLRERGKPHKVAMVACINRLVGLLNVMVRDGLRWDKLAVNQSADPAVA